LPPTSSASFFQIINYFFKSKGKLNSQKPPQTPSLFNFS
jgi:hypothetical protein